MKSLRFAAERRAGSAGAVGLFFGIAGLLGLLWGMPAAVADETEEQALQTRAQAYWDTQVREDWAAAASFLYPDPPAAMSVKQFVAKQQVWPFRYLEAQVAAAVVTGNLAWVQVNYVIELKRRGDDLPPLEPKHLQLWEPWKKQGDVWYVLTKEQRESVPRLPPQLRSAGEESNLMRRVQEFWQARQAMDWEKAYQYLEPTYRDQVSKEEFLQRKSYYTYLAHGLEWVEAIGDEGRARVRYTGKANDPSLAKLDPQEKVINENWTKIDDQWYLQVPH